MHENWLEWMKVGGENGPQDRWNVATKWSQMFRKWSGNAREMVRKRPEIVSNWLSNGQEAVKIGRKWPVNGPKWSPNGHEMDHFDTFVVVCRGET